MASKFGLSSVWTSATRTITHTSNALGNVASACDALSSNLELNAWLSVATTATETLKEMNVTVETPSQAISEVQTIMASIRGY